MPTQRPFLANFLAAFRAQSPQLPKAAPSISSSAAVAASATIWTSSTSSRAPQSTVTPTSPLDQPSSQLSTNGARPINSKTNPYPTTSQQQPLPADRGTLQHLVSPTTHLPRSPPTSPGTHLPVYGPPNKPPPNFPTVQEARARRARRGSASSADSGGFREVRVSGAEKLYIGGRTAQGEERYYQLGMVRRDRSEDRRSADQLSL